MSLLLHLFFEWISSKCRKTYFTINNNNSAVNVCWEIFVPKMYRGVRCQICYLFFLYTFRYRPVKTEYLEIIAVLKRTHKSTMPEDAKNILDSMWDRTHTNATTPPNTALYVVFTNCAYIYIYNKKKKESLNNAFCFAA